MLAGLFPSPRHGNIIAAVRSCMISSPAGQRRHPMSPITKIASQADINGAARVSISVTLCICSFQVRSICSPCQHARLQGRLLKKETKLKTQLASGSSRVAERDSGTQGSSMDAPSGKAFPLIYVSPLQMPIVYVND